MKRCPECRRDYYDDTLLYCLDDGNALLEGPASVDEPATAILSEPGAVATGFPVSESPTRAQINTTDQTAILRTGSEAEPQDSLGNQPERQSLSAHLAAEPQGKVGSRQRQLAVVGIAVVVLIAGFLGYRYFVPTKQIESIAVMPFVNESGNADVEYLSDGMTETLISSLSQLPNLNVKGRSSVFRYKGKDVDTKTLGKELGVQAVLYGRVIQRGDQLTLSLELLDAVTENVIWSGKYDRKQADLVSLQSEIVRDVSNKLKTKLSGADVAKVEKRYTANPEAYRLYLQGRFNWNKRTAEGLSNAAEFYRGAIDKDPGFALAYAGLADTYVITGAYGTISPSEAMPQAKAAALKAIELDSSLAEPRAALGVYYAGYGWDFERGMRELRRATELNPDYATAWHWLGNGLPILGKNEEAITAAKRAEEIDPLSPIISADTGFDLILLRRYDDAIEQARHTFSIDPNFWYAHYIMGVAYDLKGMHAEAVAELRRSVELNPDTVTRGRLATALARSGQGAEAQSLLNDLVRNSANRYTQGYYLATAQLALGDKDAAFASLDRDLHERGIYMQWLAINPEFDRLRDDPRFAEMVKKMGSMKLQ